MIGIVSWWDSDRGWGFIAAGESEVFVHHSALTDRENLREGDEVEFEAGIGARGLVALGVSAHSN